MSNGEAVTGTRDEHYSVVSVLYHALQAAETSQMYIDDARRGGDDEVTSFLELVQPQDRERSEQAKRLLAPRLR